MGFTEQQQNEAFETVLERICDGESLRSILRAGKPSKGKLPKWTTFFEWVDNSEAKANQYARACEIRSEYYIDEMLRVAYEMGTSETTKYDGDGKLIERLVTDDVKHRRLIVETLDKARARMQPKRKEERKEEQEFGELIEYYE
jgi:YD repeat-containing protein